MDHELVNERAKEVISNSIVCMKKTNKGIGLVKILVIHSFTYSLNDVY